MLQMEHANVNMKTKQQITIYKTESNTDRNFSIDSISPQNAYTNFKLKLSINFRSAALTKIKL